MLQLPDCQKKFLSFAIDRLSSYRVGFDPSNAPLKSGRSLFSDTQKPGEFIFSGFYITLFAHNSSAAAAICFAECTRDGISAYSCGE